MNCLVALTAQMGIICRKELKTFYDNTTQVLLAAPSYFKRMMDTEEAAYGVG